MRLKIIQEEEKIKNYYENLYSGIKELENDFWVIDNKNIFEDFKNILPILFEDLKMKYKNFKPYENLYYNFKQTMENNDAFKSYFERIFEQIRIHFNKNEIINIPENKIYLLKKILTEMFKIFLQDYFAKNILHSFENAEIENIFKEQEKLIEAEEEYKKIQKNKKKYNKKKYNKKKHNKKYKTQIE
jgi:hypothetical protein